MKTITESEFKDALKIVDAYFDQMNKKIENCDSMTDKKTSLLDLPFSISPRLLYGLMDYYGYNDNNWKGFTVGCLEGINIRTFCVKTSNIGEASGRELRTLCNNLGIHYIY